MSFKIIYEPSGRAREYADLALNIYDGCSMGCKYCYAPCVLKKDRQKFHETAKERANVLEKVKKDCEQNLFEDRAVLLCFTCDPYQKIDEGLQLTREVLKLFKQYNVNFKMLTKGGWMAERDFDLYKPGDSFGCTLTFLNEADSAKWEPNTADPVLRLAAIRKAHMFGINTWVSIEPVIDPEQSLALIEATGSYVDLIKIGKLNSENSRGSAMFNELVKIEKSIDWKAFGKRAEALCVSLGVEYYIKDDLRKEMEK